MGFMVEQARRLMRTTWTDPQQLAEELYAMFNSADAIKITSPVTIYGGGAAVPPVTIVTPGVDGDTAVPPISYVPGGTQVNVPPFAGFPTPGVPPWTGIPGITLDTNGLPRPDPTIPGVPPLPTLDPPPIPGIPTTPGVPPPPPATSGGGNGLMALVLNKVGGQIYQCRVYSGSITTPVTTPATALGVDATSDALNGVYCAAFKIGTAYYITPAVFGEESP